MDIFFRPTIGKPFSIELGYFDTVLEIKEKIHKYHGIPVSTQTLVFKDNVLPDTLNVHYSDIIDGSEIRVLISVDPENQNTKHEELTTPTKIQLILKMPNSNLDLALKMEVTDTIKKVKERVHEMEGIPTSRLIIQANGNELQDQRTLKDCELVDQSEIDVIVGPSSAASASTKIKILVMTMCKRKIAIEVNPTDIVGVLKRELEKLNKEMNLNLYGEGYFFIFKQNVMDENRSFRWHRVGQGDTIEIFNGTISDGS